MSGEDPMKGAGWGRSSRREGFSERDPALGRRRAAEGERSGQLLPLGAFAIALVGLIGGLAGSVASSPGDARFDLTVAGGIARGGYAIAILAGLWISFGSRDRAAGAQLVGVAIVALSLVLLIIFS